LRGRTFKQVADELSPRRCHVAAGESIGGINGHERFLPHLWYRLCKIDGACSSSGKTVGHQPSVRQMGKDSERRTFPARTCFRPFRRPGFHTWRENGAPRAGVAQITERILPPATNKERRWRLLACHSLPIRRSGCDKPPQTDKLNALLKKCPAPRGTFAFDITVARGPGRIKGNYLCGIQATGSVGAEVGRTEKEWSRPAVRLEGPCSFRRCDRDLPAAKQGSPQGDVIISNQRLRNGVDLVRYPPG